METVVETLAFMLAGFVWGAYLAHRPAQRSRWRTAFLWSSGIALFVAVATSVAAADVDLDASTAVGRGRSLLILDSLGSSIARRPRHSPRRLPAFHHPRRSRPHRRPRCAGKAVSVSGA
jgi:hypothetical protein